MKRRAPVLNRDALTAEIAALSKASIKDLRQRWKTLYGKEPSGHIGRSFVIRAIAVPPPGKGFRRAQAIDPTPARSGRRRVRGRELAEEPVRSKGGTGNDSGP